MPVLAARDERAGARPTTGDTAAAWYAALALVLRISGT